MTVACTKDKTAAGGTGQTLCNSSNSPAGCSSRSCHSHVEDAQPAGATGPGWAFLQPGPVIRRTGRETCAALARGERERWCPLMGRPAAHPRINQTQLTVPVDDVMNRRLSSAMTSLPNAIHTRSAMGPAFLSILAGVEHLRLVVYRPRGAMSERPVYLRLTAEQVESIMHPAQGDTMAGLAALLSGRIARGGIPPVEVWEERALEETVESRFSFSLVRGLMLLAQLADGKPARLADLAADLKLSEGVAGTYVRTLLMARLVEQDPETGMYRLVG